MSPAWSTELADRIREQLAGRDVVEKPMFGSLCFMVDGAMLVCASRGAMLALELVEPGGTRPSPDAAKRVAAACHAEGVLVLVCGTFGNVIRLLPPLVIDEELLDDGLTVLEKAVRAL